MSIGDDQRPSLFDRDNLYTTPKRRSSPKNGCQEKNALFSKKSGKSIQKHPRLVDQWGGPSGCAHSEHPCAGNTFFCIYDVISRHYINIHGEPPRVVQSPRERDDTADFREGGMVTLVTQIWRSVYLFAVRTHILLSVLGKNGSLILVYWGTTMKDKECEARPHGVIEAFIQWRKEHNVSKAAAARKLGVERTALTKWEAGRAFPSQENMARLRHLLAITSRGAWIEVVSKDAHSLIAQLDDVVVDSLLTVRSDGPGTLLNLGWSTQDPFLKEMIQYLHSDKEPRGKGLGDQARLYLEATEVVAGCAGYAAGRLKYAVDASDQEQWRSTGFRLFIELGIQHSSLRKEVRPEVADPLWKEACTRLFAAGYALAVSERLDDMIVHQSR